MATDIFITPTSGTVDFNNGVFGSVLGTIATMKVYDSLTSGNLSIQNSATSNLSGVKFLNRGNPGNVFEAYGTYGNLFTISDDLTDSIFSINNSAGLPVFDVYSNNSVYAGQYASGDFTISGNKIGIGTKTPSSKLQVIGTVTAPSFVGALTGNASTATILATARLIGGVSFNGSADINLPGVNAGGTQNTTGTASSISGFNNPTTAATANTIVYRDGSGHIIGNYILGGYFNSSAGNSENPTIGQIWTQSTGDNYLRKSTPAHFRSQVTDGSYPSLTGANASGTWSINVTGNAGGSSASCTGNAASASYANEIGTYFLNTATVSINNQRTAVYRNENGLGSNLAYSPVLHVSASDTMWQVQGTYGSSGNGTFYFRQGYQGVFGNWLTMLSSANYSSYALPLSGGTLTGTLNGTTASFSTKVLSSRFHDSGDAFLFRSGSGSGTTRHINLADTNSDPSNNTGGTGITWGERSDNNPYYLIYPRYSNNGVSTHNRLAIAWHTGIEIGASPAYGGTRFFNNSPFLGSEIFSVGKTDDNVRVTNTIFAAAFVGPLTGNITGTAASIFGFSNPTTAATANTIVYRDSGGDIYGRYLFGSYQNSSDDTSSTGITYIMAKFGNDYHRSASAAKVATFISGQTMNINGSSTSCSGTASLADSLNQNNNYTVSGFRANGSIYSGSGNSSYGGFQLNSDSHGLRRQDQTNDVYCYTTSGTLYLGAGGSSTTHVRVTSGGDVGIGVSPSYKLDVNGNIHATAFPTSSDIRFKKNITPLENSLEKVKKLQGVKYEWNEFVNSVRDGYKLNVPIIGLIAQDVEKIVPEVVDLWKLSDDCQDARSIDYPRLIPVLIEAIKEQQIIIENQNQKIENLISRVSALETK